jgi:hypothetical protein
MNTKKVVEARKLLDEAIQEVDDGDLAEIVRKLHEFSPEGGYNHEGLRAEIEETRKSVDDPDWYPPMISEYVLYTFLGKEDARTFLARWNSLCEELFGERLRS